VKQRERSIAYFLDTKMSVSFLRITKAMIEMMIKRRSFFLSHLKLLVVVHVKTDVGHARGTLAVTSFVPFDDTREMEVVRAR